MAKPVTEMRPRSPGRAACRAWLRLGRVRGAGRVCRYAERADYFLRFPCSGQPPGQQEARGSSPTKPRVQSNFSSPPALSDAGWLAQEEVITA